MPLKIRCPHCFRVLVAADETAGQTKLCPACGQTFNVPLPPRVVSKAPTAQDPARPGCPRCGAEVAPTMTYCPKCHTDLATGRRLVWRRRLRLLSWRFWVIAGLAAAGVMLAVLVAIQVYLIRARPGTTPFVPVAPQVLPTAELAEQLLGARSAAQRSEALRQLSGIELRVAPAVAAALAASLASPTDDPQLRWNQFAAIDLLARHGHARPQTVPEWLELLQRCGQQRALHEAALRARAILGDTSAAPELESAWLERLRRMLLLSRVARVAQVEAQPGVRLVLRQASAGLARCAEGLRVLGNRADSPIFEHLAAAYWESWNWLGQARGDRLADELFDLASPAEKTLDFRPEDVRQPRDVMKAVATGGSPAARAAAGLVLEQRGPQYKTLCRQIADGLGAALAESSAADQQRLTWVIARLRGQLFGPAARTHPLDVTEEEIAAALQWARPEAAPALQRPYPEPPKLVYRAVTAERLLERDLLSEIQQGWAEVRPVLDRWQAAGLGCTLRVHELLHPGQRRPDYPALATGLVLVAEDNDQTVRAQLALWREATEQPAWVRALAYTVLGSFDARRGRWDSGWPAGLDLGDTRLLDAGTPGWDVFGRVLAAGGPAMLERLRSSRPASLSPEASARLLEAAKSAAARATSGRE